MSLMTTVYTSIETMMKMATTTLGLDDDYDDDRNEGVSREEGECDYDYSIELAVALLVMGD